MSLPRHNQIGIHLTTHHVRMALFGARAKKIISVAEYQIPQTLTELRTKPSDQLAAALKTTASRLKGLDGNHRVVVCLGDEEVFTRILTFPLVSLDEIRTATPSELESDLPLSADAMYVDLYPLRPLPDDKQEVMAFAVARQTIDWLVAGLAQAHFNPIAVETASLSLGRLQDSSNKAFVTVDIGTNYASIAVIANGLMHVNTSVALHDEDWARLVASPSPRVTLEALSNTFASLFTELTENIQATIRYYHNRSENQAEVSCVYLSGSGARVPHLDTLLNKELKLPVRLNHPQIKTDSSLEASFFPAVGAAIYNPEL